MVFAQLWKHLGRIEPVPVAATLVALFIVSRISTILRARKIMKHLPGIRPPFYPLGFPGALFSTSWWNAGMDVHWHRRSQLYKEEENISIIPLIVGEGALYTSNLDVLRQVASGGARKAFIKPEDASRALLVWGMNLVAADGDTWRKHRRIMGPAFNSELYRMVWDQTKHTYHEMIRVEGWETKSTVEVPVLQDHTFKLALLVIGSCGFGFPFTWTEPARSSTGDMSVQEAIRIVTDSWLLSVFPSWISKLPFEACKRYRDARQYLVAFMREQVRERKNQLQGDAPKNGLGANVFSRMVLANSEENAKLQMEDSELIGNVFALLFAGHETTAHTLAATLGFLAYYNEMQEEVVQQINSVVPKDREPAFEDYQKLDKVVAVFFEALRLFPAGHIMIREAAADTVLEIPNPPHQEGTTALPVPKGFTVVVDMVGVQYNPRYFEDPYAYKPQRWYGTSPDSESFMAFSVGARSCIGRKFALTEAVCFLALILRDWKVEPLLSKDETREAWRDRVLDAKVIITLGVNDVPLVFTKRV